MKISEYNRKAGRERAVQRSDLILKQD